MVRFQKTLIAEQNREYVLQIREILKDLTDEVEFCFDGEEARRIYDRFHPDLVLVEAILPKLDGFVFMEHIKQDGPVKILLTSVNKDIIIKKAFELHADYVFVKPYQKEFFKERIVEVAEYKMQYPGMTAPMHSEQAIRNRVSSALKILGVPANFKGYSYLREALMIACNDFSALDSLQKNIYKKLAEMFGTTEKCIERNIRHAIEVSSIRGDTDVYYKYFGYTVNSDTGKPTNGEFIAALADKIMV